MPGDSATANNANIAYTLCHLRLVILPIDAHFQPRPLHHGTTTFAHCRPLEASGAFQSAFAPSAGQAAVRMPSLIYSTISSNKWRRFSAEGCFTGSADLLPRIQHLHSMLTKSATSQWALSWWMMRVPANKWPQPTLRLSHGVFHNVIFSALLERDDAVTLYAVGIALTLLQPLRRQMPTSLKPNAIQRRQAHHAGQDLAVASAACGQWPAG